MLIGGTKIAGGLDFSGFCEALHMLGVRAEEEDLMKAFLHCFGGAGKKILPMLS